MKNTGSEILKGFKIYYLGFGLLVILLLILSPYAAFIGLAISAIMIFIMYRDQEKRTDEIEGFIDNLSDAFDSAAKYAIFNMPFPLVLVDINGKVNWANSVFLKWIDSDNIIGKEVDSIIPDFDFKMIKESNKVKESLVKGDRTYSVYSNLIDVNNNAISDDDVLLLYFVDNSDYFDLVKKYDDEKVLFGHLYVDNYNEARTSTDDINRPLFLAEIDKTIINYFTEFGAVIRKYENDKYIIMMEKFTFENLKEDSFSILDKVKELYMGNTVSATLSMGISDYNSMLLEGYHESRSCIDLALARGGDQVVVKVGDGHIYYGGRSKAKEKSNKVRARVIGLATKQLIDQADRVFIMGHMNPDMDSIGAGIGILRAVKNRDKEGYIVLNKSNPSIENIMERMKEEQPSMIKEMIKQEDALAKINREKSLLILVDNHKPSFTEAPKLLDEFNSIIIIDHHRRGTEFVENPVLTYIEPYASSTCELVTEMLTYMSDDLNLTEFEADALMAGIMVDTKAFSFQTGVRTFEATSTLKRSGADMTRVKRLFKNDFSTIKTKASIIENSKVIFDNIALGVLGHEEDHGLLLAAQAADELLEIEGIAASFVLYDNGEFINISGRSLGGISVQLILEELGGGGHLVSAGAQLFDVTLEGAKKILEEAIGNYLKENDK
ncbi:MAG: phosphoesterase [Tissierellia bacterium]|nr:phosphoesterase [Tissierellia bacterium]